MTLVIPKNKWDEIRQHGVESYPEESCGVLLGTLPDDGSGYVEATVRCGNVSSGGRAARYEIAPAELFRIQRECRENEAEIIGFYHSHPDHPARWSETDLAEAHWTGCAYVITAVENGRPRETRSFRLRGPEEHKHFEEEAIEIV